MLGKGKCKHLQSSREKDQLSPLCFLSVAITSLSTLTQQREETSIPTQEITSTNQRRQRYKQGFPSSQCICSGRENQRFSLTSL